MNAPQESQRLELDLVVPFSDVGRADVARVGGKGANLGEMVRAEVPVPPGVIVTTAAWARFIAGVPDFDALCAVVDNVLPDDVEGARKAGGAMREALLAAPIPDDVADAVGAAHASLGEDGSYAVRSSATAEDLEGASFAGQQDTYLNVRGRASLLENVRACWASLFTDRAVLYRARAGFASREAALAVVIQRMVAPEVSGILFTADPVSGHRQVAVVDASYGLGEALVSGLVNADVFRIEKATGRVSERRLGDKAIQIRPLAAGGTETIDTPDADRERACIDDAALAELAALARRVEAWQGQPQDIEWAIEGGVLHLLQSRPITSLFPIPVSLTGEAKPDDDGLHVYASFNHVQVMMDPISPLGMDTLGVVLPLGKPSPTEPSTLLRQAAGRIFMDLTPLLLHRLPRKLLPKAMHAIDDKMAAMTVEVVSRPAFTRRDSRPRARMFLFARTIGRRVVRGIRRNLFRKDLAGARREFDDTMDAAVAKWRAAVAEAPSLSDRVAMIPRALDAVFDELIPVFPPMVIAGGICWRLLSHLTRKVVEPGKVAAISRGLTANATTEMDLVLGDLADIARDVPALRDGLAAIAERASGPEGHTRPDDLDALRDAEGARPFFEGWDAFINKYGHRGPGEIDIASLRWNEDPSSLLLAVVGMMQAAEPGGHRAQHAKAAAEAEAMRVHLVDKSRRGLFGARRARLVGRLVDLARTYLALREHGKFHATRLFFVVREVMLEAGGALVERGALDDARDVFWLRYRELVAATAEGVDRSSSGDLGDLRSLVVARRAEAERNRPIRPPRLITNDGEIPHPPAPPLPDGTLAGMAASAGTIEGVARVIHDPTREVLDHGEVLIAPFTDPGWTPLFVHASALVMEVGGLMTHGSVVAREYGIPAVVGVDDACTRIRTGQRVRVDGDTGRVTLLDAAPAGAEGADARDTGDAT